jgi:glyoxylase-like metal-dependent hydrolase (beta-lactamase superfamily II)
MKITAIEGNHQKLDGGSMFGNVPRPMWERWASPDKLGRIELACRALLIEWEEKKVLCEAGIGAFFAPKLAERYGVQNHDSHELIKNLQKKNISHEDIDYLILSHLHFDHAGGLLPSYLEQQKGNSQLLFPRAKYVTSRVAFERACHPHPRDRASFIPGLTDKLKASKRLVLLSRDQTHIEGLPKEKFSFFFSDGHTPGQMHTYVKGKKQTVFFCGDLVPGLPWVHLPVTMGYDRYPEKIIDEKKERLSKAAKESCWLFYTHDLNHPMSRCELDERGKMQVTHLQNSLLDFSLDD